jgi:predicted ATP-grasp superfamily ATP-dependent carboligase
VPPAEHLPPAIVVGGTDNALSVTRRLARHGITVYTLNHPTAHVRYSRFGHFVPVRRGPDPLSAWLEILGGGQAAPMRGGVLLPCDDEAVELVARHRAELSGAYRLIEGADDVLLAMLDKATTYELARKAGVPAPAVWTIGGEDELAAACETIAYPCALKPRHSHLFRKKQFDKKALVASNRDELFQAFAQAHDHGLKMLLTEIVPGAEAAYCSYYSYLDEELRPLFDFTKRKLRQNPPGFGMGTYHLSDWSPEVADMGLRFLRGAGLRGFGNVEFKRDARDGHLKLIECNARFTRLHEMLEVCGLDVTLLVYNRLAGRPLPQLGRYRSGVWFWLPSSDFAAFRSLNQRGELSLAAWSRSLLRRPHFLRFEWGDPLPTLMHFWTFLRERASRRWQSLSTRVRTAIDGPSR